jgi:hypothetical protein
MAESVSQDQLARQGVLVRQLQSIYLFGVGAPSGAPQAPRAVYTRLDGGTGSTLYVWEGSSWVAK